MAVSRWQFTGGSVQVAVNRFSYVVEACVMTIGAGHFFSCQGEKSELREEKIRLKAEKEKLEQQLKAVTLPPGYMPHSSAVQAAAAAFAAQAQAAAVGSASKPLAPTPIYPNLATWHWLPPSSEPGEEQARYSPVA